MTKRTVFISYSHDSPEHSERVLNLAWALRSNGIDVEIDQFHNEEIVDWPRWCNEQTSAEHSEFVVCVCTAEYRRRIEGKVPPEKGKGVYWEGSLLDDDLYDAKGNSRLIPILLDGEPESSIPRFLRGWTHCRMSQFGLDDPGYEHLLRILTGQAKVEKNALGSVPELSTKRAPSGSQATARTDFQADIPRPRIRSLLALFGCVVIAVGAYFWWTGGSTLDLNIPDRPSTPVVQPSLRPAPLAPNLSRAEDAWGEKFIGRVNELRELDEAWRSVLTPIGTVSETAAPIRTIGVTGWGGFDQTELLRQWLWIHLEQEKWSDGEAPEAVFWFDFGGENSPDIFLIEAIHYFSGSVPELASLPTDGLKLDALKKFIGQRRFILVLDSLETHQSDLVGESFGQCSGLLQMLLREHTAGRLGQGLCLVTSRLQLTDVAESPAYRAIDLESPDRALSDTEVRSYLTLGGVTECSEAELHQLVEVTGRHPLALATLAAYLAEFNQGRAAGWQQFRGEVLTPPTGRETERQLWQVLSWWDQKLSKRELQVMTTIAHFREPVQFEWLLPLLVAGGKPPVAESPSPPKQENERTPAYTLAELALPGERCTVPELRQAIERLVKFELINHEKAGYSAHSLIREHFQQRASAQDPEACKEFHTRIYRLYSSVVQPEFQPDTLEELLPLYEAVYHGCQAGLQQEACDKVFFARILRRDEYYSTRQLGAFGSDLGGIACFFETPWSRVSTALEEDAQAWLLGESAFNLRALGRLTEAVEPMRAGLEMNVMQKDWMAAAVRAGNLSELELTLGEVARAVGDAEQSVTYADRSGDLDLKMMKRTTHANALHQAGRRDEAASCFRWAEALQAQNQPYYPLLYSLHGYQYCDLLLTEAERAAWQVILASNGRESAGSPRLVRPTSETPVDSPPPLALNLVDDCRDVEQRAAQTLKWEEGMSAPLLDFALHHLTLGRAAFYAVILSRTELPPNVTDTAQRVPTAEELDTARRELDAAVAGLRRAGHNDHLPDGLLTRAWLRFVAGERIGDESAQTDLDEAWEIAERGSMKLFLADIHLYRARLFGRKEGEKGRQGEGETESTYPWESPQADLAAAQKLIEQCGYGRRKGELEDAEQALLGKRANQ